MFMQHLFNLVCRLIFSRWARDYEEHHGQYENAYAARLGPLHLEVNRCFVLEHDDAFISIRVPIPVRHAQSQRRASRGGWLWGKLHLGYVVCLGEDELRQPGFYAYLPRPLPKFQPGQAICDPDDEFPF